ncbi:MAG: rRNA cytosine-C5-methyltransferase, partial [Bacteroidales bacterium]|nr:rRNA cytosine-C5-methyltransferase [Bacteroidales bacterium]
MNSLPVSIRLNPFKFKDIQGAPVPWNRWGRILESRPVFTLDPLFHAGVYYVQDSSAMFPGHLFRRVLESFPGRTVRDLCAAPGG